MIADLRVAKALFIVEVKLFIREPFAIFFTLILPSMLMVVFSSVFGKEVTGYKEFTVADMIIPSSIAIVIAYLGLMGLPIALSEYREMGVLRRFKASPLGLGSLMIAHVVVHMIFFVVSSIVVVILSGFLFDTKFRGNLLGFILVTSAGALAAFAVGFLLVGLTKGTRTAQAVGMGLFFPMIFLSGATIPRTDFPAWLQSVSDWIPLSSLVDEMAAMWVGLPFTAQTWVLLAAIPLIAIAMLAASNWLFRWD